MPTRSLALEPSDGEQIEMLNTHRAASQPGFLATSSKWLKLKTTAAITQLHEPSTRGDTYLNAGLG